MKHTRVDKSSALPGTLMGVTQLPITKAVDDGYQICILYFKLIAES